MSSTCVLYAFRSAASLEAIFRVRYPGQLRPGVLIKQGSPVACSNRHQYPATLDGTGVAFDEVCFVFE